MAALVFRLLLLAAGMGAIEIGLGNALVDRSLIGWGLALLVGLPLIFSGSAGFMAPLFGGAKERGTIDA